MSQFDFGNLESPLSGTVFINGNLEPWRDALHSTHKGPSRPSYAVAGLNWINDTTNPWVWNVFDGTDDIIIGYIDISANTFTPARAGTLAAGQVLLTNLANEVRQADWRGRNVIINGDFQVAQRNTTFTTPASNATTLDRWRTLYNGTIGTFTLSRQSFTLGQTDVPTEPQYFLRWAQTVAGSASTFRQLAQFIESVRTFAGQQITLSFYAKADAARTVTGTMRQSFGTGGSPSTAVDTTAGTFNLTTAWQKFSQTVSIPSISGKTLGSNGDDYLGLLLSLPVNTTMTIDIAQVQVELGAYATAFNKRDVNTEISLCQRYYSKTFSADTPPTTTTLGAMNAVAFITNTSGLIFNWRFPTEMRTAPTVSIYNPDTGTATIRNVTNSSDLAGAVTNISSSGAVLSNSAGATVNSLYRAHLIADAEL